MINFSVKSKFNKTVITFLPTIFVACFLLTAVSGCMSYHREMGLENIWREKGDFVRGESNQADIMQTLGPPSQIVDLNGRAVFYYLQEQVKGKRYFFLIYNWSHEKTVYDRAMFVFDSNGILEEFAYSHEDLGSD